MLKISKPRKPRKKVIKEEKNEEKKEEIREIIRDKEKQSITIILNPVINKIDKKKKELFDRNRKFLSSKIR